MTIEEINELKKKLETLNGVISEKKSEAAKLSRKLDRITTIQEKIHRKQSMIERLKDRRSSSCSLVICSVEMTVDLDDENARRSVIGILEAMVKQHEEELKYLEDL